MWIYDKDKSRSLHTLEDVVAYSDFIFLSVPTPSNSDGSINLSYVEDALQEISEINSELDMVGSPVESLVLIRSTVTPGTTEKLLGWKPTQNIEDWVPGYKKEMGLDD